MEMGRYETSRELLRSGVTSGYDITTEAAVCKMMHLLAREKDANEIKKKFKFGSKRRNNRKSYWILTFFLYLAPSFGV